MGLPNWRENYNTFEAVLLRYGNTILTHKDDRFLQRSAEDIRLASKEASNPVHVAIRVFAGKLKSHKSFANFVECLVRSDDIVRQVANGTGMPSSLVCLTGPERDDEPFYHIMVEGQIIYRARSIARAYCILFCIQNLLFLAPAEGNKDVSSLVAAINHVCFRVRYQKNPLKSNFLNFVHKLDSFVGAEVMRNLGNRK